MGILVDNQPENKNEEMSVWLKATIYTHDGLPFARGAGGRREAICDVD